ncbi:aspartic-type endopeptidase (OpsB), putative [Talaromyces islandicus]|uniref:Probable aspartic-type endopeptidase OPSB n=1 Tax=Talaromyces islandicus TaxID=28573 RepID=A0A0U1M5U5_TALIS|nr:aspartic-type endopeptidase (OpsB), putative [Talaromyces islandicus]
MKQTYLRILLGILLTADALSLHKRDSPAVVKLDVQRDQAPDLMGRNYRGDKRDKTVNQVLQNAGTMYLTNITLGSPPQRARLIIDTGSSDMWCNTKSSDLCLQDPSSCEQLGTYNANSSSTYKYLNSNFALAYVDGTSAQGDFVSDNLNIGGKTLPSFEFGVAYTSSSIGVLGLGYVGNEATGQSEQGNYPNLPQAMADNGLINSNAYSLWLDDLDANVGSILFGGVDTEKYVGDLQTVPILQIPGENPQFYINMSGLTLSLDGNTETTYGHTLLPAPAILDSGTSLTVLPDSIVASIIQDLNGTYDTQNPGQIPCSVMNKDIGLNFTFSTASVSVGIKDMLTSTQPGATMADGSQGCALGIVPTTGRSVVLGDTFLRSAYVVYDLDNDEISLANTNFNANSSGNGDSVLEIGATVPGATAVGASSTSAQRSSSSARSTPSGTSTSSPVVSRGMLNSEPVNGLCVVGLVVLVQILVFIS